MNNTNNKIIKAAYIYSILPDRIKSYLINKMDNNERTKLNNSLGKIQSLQKKDKNTILKEFIEKMNKVLQKRKNTIHNSNLLSLFILSLIIIISYTIARIKYRTTDEIIYFIELIINNGGIHFIIFPYLAGFIKNQTSQPLRQVFYSKNLFLDLAISFTASLVIALIMFTLLDIRQDYGFEKIINIYILVISTTIVPMTEELFFRFVLFYRGGLKTGFIFSSIASSLLFTIVHLPESFPEIVCYFSIAMILCGLYYYRKNILPCFLAHALANFFLQVL